MTKLNKSYTGITLHPSDIDVYKECTKTELSKVYGVKCSEPNCHNCSHHGDIDDFYDAIMGTLKMSSQSLMSNCKCDFKHAVVPGWNDKVKALHSAARDAYLIWRAIGKQGDVLMP